MKKEFTTLLVVLFMQVGFSQNYKPGKVSKEELQEQFYPLNSTVGAAYLYKKRRTYFEYIDGEGFSVITEVHERIKIYTKEGYNWATKKINYYTPNDGKKEKVIVKNAKTFTLIKGKISSQKLDKKEMFKGEINKYRSEINFTMPNITEGCIVEWVYRITSPYKSINNLVLQYSIPIKKIEVSIEIPEYYNYKTKHVGYLSINETSEVKDSEINLNVRYKTGEIRKDGGHGRTESSWKKVAFRTVVTKIEKNNIPALIEEPYVNNLDNYRAGIEYELATVKWPNEPLKHFSKSWKSVAKTILRNSKFGLELKKTKHLEDDIVLLNAKFKTPSEKIFGALEYVKNKIKWNKYYGKYTEKGLRKAHKERTGNIAEVNLTLVAVLRALEIKASPVLVSTRDYKVPIFPTLSGFNYVIVAAETEEGIVLLDASEKYSLPNVLPLRTMNWNGAIIRADKTVDFVNLSSSTISSEEYSLNYKISENGLIEGVNRVKYKDFAALSYRKKYAGIKEENVISNIESKNDDIEVLNFRASNLNNITKPLVEMYKFEKEDGVEVIGNEMYLAPLLFTSMTENPFKIEKREYPIDFGTPWEEKISVIIQVPEGYKIESIPESFGREISDSLGKFIYSTKVQGNKIQVVSLIKINSGVISANYYPEIKEMFKQIVAKQNEKIVLTKE